MFLRAKTYGKDCLINSEYIVDVFDLEKKEVSCFLVGDSDAEYKVEQSEFKKFLDSVNDDD